MSSLDAQIANLITHRPGFAAMEPASYPDAQPIAPGIWMSEGTSNTYCLDAGSHRVIINTGMGFEALVHKQAFDAVCAKPTSHILLTQGHVDHVGGVKHFREADTVVIAQANNAACQRDDERVRGVRVSQAYIWFSKTFDRALQVAKENPEILIQDAPVPDITFEEHHRLEQGDWQFELIATPGETIDSCVVWLPKQRLLFSGNVFGPLFPHFPNINTIRGDKYRFIEPYLDSVRRIRALQPETLVTGHFQPIEGGKLIAACLDRLEAAVDFVHRETLKGMNAGTDIYTLMRTVKLPPELAVGEGYGKVSWAVRTIWESYMGWFKAQSTTELYPTQAREIYAELAALAEVDAILERGHLHLNKKEPEAALHFAEIALAADIAHKPALQLSLAAHRVLLERAGDSNFWESGWLKQQIAQLEKALQA